MTVRLAAWHGICDDNRGVVLLEFLIAFVPLWIFFLAVVQLAFIAYADLLVKHSADAAARSAIVVLPDDPNEYGGEPEMSIERNPLTYTDISRALASAGAMFGASSSPNRIAAAFSQQAVSNLGRSRLNTIRLAAQVPLMPLTPDDVGRDPQPSLAKSIGTERKLLRALYYQPFALAVTFPALEDGAAVGPEITVRVTYAYQCTVPLARRILCQVFDELEGQSEFADAFLPLAGAFVGGRFRTLQHETTLMIHDAPYAYRTEGV
jgi:Flp pilus assembly protein TadG